MAPSDAELRDLLHRAAAVVGPDPDRGAAALHRGRRRLRRRRAARATLPIVCSLTLVSGVALVRDRLTSPAPSATVAVTCLVDEVTTRGRAEAAPVGVRIVATNDTGDLVRLTVGGVGAYLPPGTSTVDLPVPPGPVEVTCASPSGTTHAAALLVRDPDRVYVPDTVTCGNPRRSVLAAAGLIGQGDPVALTRQRLAGDVPAGATVEAAGYPATAARAVRVRHGSTLLAVLRWYSLPAGAWMLDSETVCPVA